MHAGRGRPGRSMPSFWMIGGGSRGGRLVLGGDRGVDADLLQVPGLGRGVGVPQGRLDQARRVDGEAAEERFDDRFGAQDQRGGRVVVGGGGGAGDLGVVEVAGAVGQGQVAAGRQGSRAFPLCW
jgi:hypothetical protein